VEVTDEEFLINDMGYIELFQGVVHFGKCLRDYLIIAVNKDKYQTRLDDLRWITKG